MTLEERKAALIEEGNEIEQEAKARSLSVNRTVQAHNAWLVQAQARQSEIRGALALIDELEAEPQEPQTIFEQIADRYDD